MWTNPACRFDHQTHFHITFDHFKEKLRLALGWDKWNETCPHGALLILAWKFWIEICAPVVFSNHWMLKVCLQTALNSTLDEIPAASEAAFSNNQQEVYADDLLCFRRTMRTYFFWCEPRAPWRFLAKVLKYTYDGGDDQLAWLRELDKRPNYYEFQAATDVCLKNNQRSYRSYQHPLGLYEFRTPKSSGLYTCPETMHPLNCKSCHIFTRTITKWQSDQVFHSLWMSWIEEQSNDWQTNIY